MEVEVYRLAVELSLWESEHWIYLLHERKPINDGEYNQMMDNLGIFPTPITHYPIPILQRLPGED